MSLLIILIGIAMGFALLVTIRDWSQSLNGVEIASHEVGFVYKNKRLVDVITEGQTRFLFGKKVEIHNLNEPYQGRHELCEIEKFPIVYDLLEVFEVLDGQIGVEYRNQLFSKVLMPGVYGYWSGAVKYRVDTYSTDKAEIGEDVPRAILAKSQMSPYTVMYTVESYEIALLFIEGAFVRKLVPGVYYFWRTEKIIRVQKADLRSQLLEVAGQEILTKDKAAIRVNFDVQYKIFDVEKAIIESKDAIRQLYTTIQLALREYIGTLTLDNILARKEEVSPFVMKSSEGRAQELGVKLLNAGLRDIILPGDVKEIMNQVLLAQKKAQANNIMRQEETASTRSLLNTAKLMEQNEMLFRLKEMEYVERVAEKVGEVTLNGGDKVLGQLRSMFST